MITNNDIQKNNLNWCMIDTIENCLILNKPFIINTDISKNTGIHWISACLINPDILYIYDSLGKINYRPYDNIMIDILNKNNIKCYWYDNPSQFTSSVLCGYYSIVVCKYMEKIKNKTIENFNNMIDYLFDNDNLPSKKDELNVIKHFGII